jgi:hypothetical protein
VLLDGDTTTLAHGVDLIQLQADCPAERAQPIITLRLGPESRLEGYELALCCGSAKPPAKEDRQELRDADGGALAVSSCRDVRQGLSQTALPAITLSNPYVSLRELLGVPCYWCYNLTLSADHATTLQLHWVQ